MSETIIEDSRQQVHHGDKHANKHNWWSAHGVSVIRAKIDAGDYCAFASNIVVDTKKGLAETATCCGRDHARFAREMERARSEGFLLVILIETVGPYHTIEDVAKWVSVACRQCDHKRYGRCDPISATRCQKYRSKPIQGATLMRIMQSMEHDHGCRFELCHPAHTAQRICELLGVDWR